MAKGKEMKARRFSNFSLVELLVSVSILMILLTLGIRSLERTYRMSQAVECSHHLKQFGNGVQLFIDDNNNILPSLNILSYDENLGEYNSKNRHIAWKFQIADYVLDNSKINYADYSKKDKSAGIEDSRATNIHPDLVTGLFECPGVHDHTFNNGLTYDDIHFSRKGGYGWNFLLQDDSKVNSIADKAFNLGVAFGEVERPSETMMIGDTLNSDVNFTFPQILYHPSRMGTRLYSTHNSGINIIWTDMHVENLSDVEIRNVKENDTSYYFRYLK